MCGTCALHTRIRSSVFLGEPRINVLQLNLALDELSAHKITVTPLAVPHDIPAPLIFGLRLSDWLQLIIFFVILTLLMSRRGWMQRCTPVSRRPLQCLWFCRAVDSLGLRVKSSEEMDWKKFSVALMVFSVIGIAWSLCSRWFNSGYPEPGGCGSGDMGSVAQYAVSFATNTNWQAYAGESVSYLTQMIGLAVQTTCRSCGDGGPHRIHLWLLAQVGDDDRELLGASHPQRHDPTPICVVISLLLVSQGTVRRIMGR